MSLIILFPGQSGRCLRSSVAILAQVFAHQGASFSWAMATVTDAIFAGLAKGRAWRQVVAAAAAAAPRTRDGCGGGPQEGRRHSDSEEDALAAEILTIASDVHSSLNLRFNPPAHSLSMAVRRASAVGWLDAEMLSSGERRRP